MLVTWSAEAPTHETWGDSATHQQGYQTLEPMRNKYQTVQHILHITVQYSMVYPTTHLRLAAGMPLRTMVRNGSIG